MIRDVHVAIDVSRMGRDAKLHMRVNMKTARPNEFVRGYAVRSIQQ
jgi:hypothetical protein